MGARPVKLRVELEAALLPVWDELRALRRAFDQLAALDLRAGGLVPGTAAAPGDSPDNDTVLARLSPGELVIPRSCTRADDALQESIRFVSAALKQRHPPVTENGKGRGFHRVSRDQATDGD